MTSKTSINFSDLWPKIGEPLVYLGPDRDTYLTHGKEYKVKDILFIPCGDLLRFEDDSGYNCFAELTMFSLLEKGK